MPDKRKTRKISKKVLEMRNDPKSVWGKNPKLEKFWGELASEKKVILIYKNGTHKYMNMPKRFTTKHETMMKSFYEDSDIVAVLSSTPSQDAYEVYLYPKAKDASVENVIKNYKKYFKPILNGAKMRVPL